MKTVLFLYDTRNPFELLPDGSSWLVFSPIEQPFKVVWVKSYDEFVEWITKNGLSEAVLFDHDLGLPNHISRVNSGMSKRASKKLKPIEKTGFDCAKWLVEYCMDNNKQLPLYNIQSANPVGKENIDGLLKSFIKNQKQ